MHEIYLENFIVLNMKRMLNFENLTVIVDRTMSGAEKYPDFFKVFLQEQHYERMVISSYTFCNYNIGVLRLLLRILLYMDS